MADLSGEDVARDQRLRAEEAAHDALVARVIALARQLRLVHHEPDHAYQPYENPRVNPGCIRCSIAEAAHPELVERLWETWAWGAMFSRLGAGSRRP